MAVMIAHNPQLDVRVAAAKSTARLVASSDIDGAGPAIPHIAARYNKDANEVLLLLTISIIIQVDFIARGEIARTDIMQHE